MLALTNRFMTGTTLHVDGGERPDLNPAVAHW